MDSENGEGRPVRGGAASTKTTNNDESTSSVARGERGATRRGVRCLTSPICTLTPASITIFRDAEATSARGAEIIDFSSFRQLKTWLATSPLRVADKRQARLYARAEQIGPTRKKKRLKPPFLILLDVDKSPVSLKEAIARLENAGVACVGHTTWSHGSKEKPGNCYRLFTDQVAWSWPDLQEATAALFEIAGIEPTPESWKSPCFFAPAVAPSRRSLYCYETSKRERSTWAPKTEREKDEPIGGKKEGRAPGEVEDVDLDELVAALEKIDNAPRETWILVGMALKATGVEGARELWDEWSAKNYGDFSDEAQETNWESFADEKGDGVGLGSVFKLARQGGWRPKSERSSPKKDFGSHLTPTLDTSEPSRVAARFAEEHEGIRCWRGGFYRWGATHWRAVGDGDMEAELREWLKRVVITTPSGKTSAYQATRKNVGDVVAALRAALHLGDSLSTPFWIDPRRRDPDPRSLLPFRNGVLDLETFEMREPDPRLFALHRVDCDHDPDAEAPRWKRFLEEIFPDDPESARTVEEILGYCLTDDTSLQKLFLWQGASRSGKGTILRVLRALVGPDRFAAPTVSSFAGEFGMQQLIGKAVAAIADARGNDVRNPHLIVERILTITGEDAVTINRKHTAFWDGTLPTRLVYVSNVPPKLKDPSGVVVTRFVAIYFRESFLGKEDPNLTDELLEELPGIVNRALAALKRLRKRKRFEQPRSGRVLLEKMDEQTGPVRAFVDDACVLAPEHQVERKALYRAFSCWLEEHGHRPMSDSTFGSDLFALGIRSERPRGPDKRRRRVYCGIALVADVGSTPPPRPARRLARDVLS
jgi:putative DNA primase/helicase